MWNMNKLKNYIVFNVVFCFFSWAHAGSFEDFFKAAAVDDESAVVALALRGFDLNARNEQGDPALIVALREDSLKVGSPQKTEKIVR